MPVRFLILALFLAVLVGCGTPMNGEVKPDDAIKDSSKSKASQDEPIDEDESEDDQASVSVEEVSNQLVVQNEEEETTPEQDVPEEVVVEEVIEDPVVEDPISPVAEDSNPEDVVEEELPKKKEKKKKKTELAGPFCPAFVDSKSKRLFKWIEKVESMNLPDLGKYPISAQFITKEKKFDDHKERFQKTYSIKIPEKLDVIEGSSGEGWATIVLRDGPRAKVTCFYRGKETGKKLRCDGKKSSYEFDHCTAPVEPGHLIKANFIRFRVKNANESCARTKVEMVLKLQSAKSPSTVACGDIITETSQLTENLDCPKNIPVALTIVGDGIILKGKGKTIQVANDKRTAILILGQKNKVRNLKLKGTKSGLGIVAFEETATNQCKRIKEVNPDMSSMGLPQSLFHRIAAGFAFLIDWIRQLFH